MMLQAVWKYKVQPRHLLSLSSMLNKHFSARTSVQSLNTTAVPFVLSKNKKSILNYFCDTHSIRAAHFTAVLGDVKDVLRCPSCSHGRAQHQRQQFAAHLCLTLMCPLGRQTLQSECGFRFKRLHVYTSFLDMILVLCYINKRAQRNT